ncbi:GRIP and coiled-coil domain-containing protein 1-like isoform X2 [Penaeus japonicus]|uniref:GRIP and coiled-coil domain-containing protein 1-like isoform X2 n=1 Tax=Penaeus japonicus TaxID=27405 RepID=UPI001C70EECA|nr:GRIP and coiled-coil domain-containing protein 1-like isoform X2 [Penaeus japonicus]
MTSKKELLTTVERQKEQLSKYEAKLKDVIRAYKGLLKEKEVLEASLSALTSVQTKTENADTEVQQNSTEKENGSAQSESSANSQQKDNEQNAVSDEASVQPPENLEALQNKVSTLTVALTTLTSEKNRIELSFQNDKKRLLSEKEKLEQQVAELQNAGKSKEVTMEEKFQDLRSRLIVAQHERDQDTQTTAVMLRELESKLAVERSAREKAETLLEEAKQAAQRPSPAATNRPLEQYEKKITDLQNELEQVRSRLKKAEQQSEKPPLLLKIQGEMEDMRMQHRQAIQQERNRAATVEESARNLAQSHEDRVATLEARLANLSLTVASYDRTRQEDLQAIQKLKEKVSELAQENTSLLSRLGPETDNNESDINTLSRQLTKLKDQLIQANLHAPHPVDLEAILCAGENIHSHCQQEYDCLKEEFENYKIIANQKSETVGENVCRGECGKQLEELRQKIRNLTTAAQLAADTHAHQILAFREEIASLRTSHESHLRRVESENRVAMVALEQQLAMQQQRSLNTLNERDMEIQRLTKEVHDLRKSSTQSGLGTLEATAAILSQVSGGSEGPLLHHLEELARKDQEVSQLRREKRLLETTMREVQMAALNRQQAQQDRIELLEEETERYRRNVSREGENLEYLKNVVLQYMISSDAESRNLMLNAISAVLKFTPSEVENVRKYNTLWWWQPAPKTGVKVKMHH